MKICIIGNSHAAALKLAWDGLAESDRDIELTFFAARGPETARYFRREGTTLLPTNKRLRTSITATSEGKDRIQIADYDAIWLCGLNVRLQPVDASISQAVREALGHDSVATTPLAKLVELIRECSDIPLIACHNPLLREPPTPEETGAVISYDEYFAMVADEVRKLGAVLLRQPEETFSAPIFTKAQYSIGSVRLDTGAVNSGAEHPEQERKHMNAHFGALVLREFIAKTR